MLHQWLVLIGVTVGALILKFFGISMPALRIADGVFDLVTDKDIVAEIIVVYSR